jgi:hypothetical protein
MGQVQLRLPQKTIEEIDKEAKHPESLVPIEELW